MLNIGIIIVVIFIYIFITQKIGGDREREFFTCFNSSNIHGELEYAKIGYHGSVFKIRGSEVEFVFYLYTSELSDNMIFYNIAEKGDTIIKEAYSDVLRLKKNNKVYIFKFRKNED